MVLRPDVIVGLRRLFQTGATYSGLLRYILAQHAGESIPSLTIQQYLMEAFSISFFCPVRRNVDSTRNDDDYAQINTWLISRILSSRNAWVDSGVSDSPPSAWWETLALTEPAQFPKGKPSWLSEASWQALSPPEQEKLASTETSCAVLAEEILVLARLAEQLQRRISDLKPPEITVQSVGQTDAVR